MASGTIHKNMVLLWSNPSPASNFSAQSINLNLDGFDAMLIIYWYGVQSGNQIEISQTFPVNNQAKWLMICSTTNISGGRKCTYNPSTHKMTFEGASYSGSSNAAYVIPVFIYGLKA